MPSVRSFLPIPHSALMLVVLMACSAAQAAEKGPCNTSGYYKAGNYYLLASMMASKQTNIEESVKGHAKELSSQYKNGKRNFVTHQANKNCIQAIPNEYYLVLFAVDLKDADYSWAAVYGGMKEWWVSGRGTKWAKLSESGNRRAYTWGALKFVFEDPADDVGYHPHDILYQYDFKGSVYIE